MRRWTRTLFVGSLLFSYACGDDAASVDAGDGGSFADAANPDTGIGPDAGIDAGFDAGLDRDTGVEIDAGFDAGWPDHACLPTPDTLTIAPSGTVPQFRPAVLFDGSSIWIAYSAANTARQFIVMLTRLGCDGTTILEPTQVNTSTIGDSINPALALSGDRLLMAWQRDTHQGGSNLDILLRLFDADGVPLEPSDRTLEMSRKGVPQAGNAWMPSVATLPSGFVVSGAWGHDEAPAFQVFAQRLDTDGNLVGDAIDVALDRTATQIEPSVVATSTGTIWVAWYDGDVYVASLDVGSTTFTSSAASDGANPRLSVSEDDRVFLAYTRIPREGGGTEAGLVDLSRQISTFIHTGLVSKNHMPVVAWREGRGATVYYRNRQGQQNDVVFSALSDGEGQLVAAPGFLVPIESPAAPYPTTLAPLGDGAYFSAWIEGSNPDLYVKGRFFYAP